MLHKLIVNTYNLWVVVFVALGTLTTAYGLAIIGSTVGQASFYTYFGFATAGEPGYAHTTNLIGGLNGVNSAGAIVGCILSAWSADKYSRKYTMLMGCVVLAVGGALCAGAVDYGMFLVGRFIAGLGAGVSTILLKPYRRWPGLGIDYSQSLLTWIVRSLPVSSLCTRRKSQRRRREAPWFL